MGDLNPMNVGPTPLSVGKVRMSRQVFGDLVAEESVQNQSMVSMHSLCYSPSPVPDTECQTRETPTPMAIMFESERSVDEHTEIQEKKSSFVVGGPFKNIIGDDDDEKENQTQNNGENQVLDSLRKSTNSSCQVQKELPKKSVQFQPKRQKYRTALSRDRRLKTQTAIDSATDSVNKTLNAVRKAKEESQRERARQTSRVRDQWKEEKVEAKEFYAIAEKSRREILSLQKELSSKFRKQKANSNRNNMRERLNEIDRESQFKSKAYRNQQRQLKEEMDRRKRMSIEARAELRKNHRDGEERMKMAAIAEDQALMQERYESSIANRENKKLKADQRRKSFQFRNGDARRIRKLHAKMEADRLENEHVSFELKWNGERDAEAYQKQLAEDRRKSLAFRNKESCKHRELEANMYYDEKQAEHASYESKWGGERDAEAYKKQLAEDRRKSLAFRNREGHEHRELEANMHNVEKQAEHASYELKWDGERDAEAYKKQQAENRRNSLAYRNKEGHRQRELEANMFKDEKQVEHASYELKWDGERDANAYKKMLAEDRRKSLAFRNKEGNKHRELEAKMCHDEKQKEHASYELKWGGERDADAYKKMLAENRRKSFAFRNKEGVRHRELESQIHHEEKEAEHANYELKWDGERDADAYKKQLADDRRKSLAFRNEERARHEKVMVELKALAKEQETESLWAKWSGENDAKEYVKKLEEERRKSLQLRNEEGKRHREIDSENQSNAIQEAHNDENLRAEDWRDIQEYRKACSDRDRASLCFRRKEANLQRLEEEEDRQRQEEIDEKNWKLEHAARSDVKTYIEDCKRRRRMSLANRAKEKRRHAKWERDQAVLEQQKTHRDTRDRALDRRYVELAKQKELARIALDAIRHAGCSFNVNPFAAMLD